MDLDNESGNESDYESGYEIAVINFSKVLNSHSRRSEISARMARFEFLSLLICSDDDVEIFINRVGNSYRGQGFTPMYSSILRESNESPLTLLNRLDLAVVKNPYPL